MSESSPPRTPPHRITSHDNVSPLTPFVYEPNPDDDDEVFPRSGRRKEQDGTPVTTNTDATRFLDNGLRKRVLEEIEEEQKKELKILEKEVKKLYKEEEKEKKRLDENEKLILDRLNEQIEDFSKFSKKGGKKSKKYRKNRFRKTSKYKGGNKKGKRSIKRHTKNK